MYKMLKTSFFNWHYYQYLLFFYIYICIYLYNVPLTVDVVVQWLINHSFLRPPTPSWLTGSVTNQVLQGQEPIRKVCGESPHQLISIRSEQPFKFLLFGTFSMSITSLSTSSSLSITVLYLFTSSLSEVFILTSDEMLLLKSYFSLPSSKLRSQRGETNALVPVFLPHFRDPDRNVIDFLNETSNKNFVSQCSVA